MIDLIQEILATLRSNKLRTALTGFAVSWGIFLLIVLLSCARGVMNSFDSYNESRDNSYLRVWGGWANKPWKGYKEGRPIRLRDGDKPAILSRNARNAESVAATINNDTSRVSTQKDYLSSGYQGVYPEAMKIYGFTMRKGRFINDFDIKGRRRVAAISEHSADLLFGSDEPVGKYVNIAGLSFTVIGIYDSDRMDEVYIPFSTARAMSGGGDRVDELAIKLRNIDNIAQGDEAEKSIRQTFSAVHTFDPDDESAVYTWNMLNSYFSNLEANRGLIIAIWVIGALTLLSGIVGVSNIMFVSVRERTHEIGIRRAIGARPRNILTQVIVESAAITSLFGYIGIVAGMLVAKLIGVIAGDNLTNPTITLSMAIEVTVVLILTGSLAGLFPALKAIKIKPVEALRDE